MFDEEDSGERYQVDQVGDDYVIFDRAFGGQRPIVYKLFVVPVQNNWYNYQAILTMFDATVNPEKDYPQFIRELWSTFFYLDDWSAPCIHSRILTCLVTTEIEHPYELSYLFGGTVRNEKPISVEHKSNIC